MKVLVIGNGGREHAIAWKLCQSSQVDELLMAPGNAGTAGLGRNVDISTTEVDTLVRFAQETQADFTVVGSEAPLAAGIVDQFQESGLEIFGPTKYAARIETSKSWAKQLMLDHGVPTGKAEVFYSYAEAVSYARKVSGPIVIKADGLAAGKGVMLSETQDDALEALRTTMEERLFGSAGDTVLIEERLEGREVSVFAFVDGERVSAMATACDYKRIGDGDVGPNTGGMGAYSPAPVVTDEIAARAMAEIIEPTVAALAEEGRAFTGFLYAGLMIDATGSAKVLEFNVRLGDPETQPILMRLESDLLALIEAALAGTLDQTEARWREEAALGVVLTAGGYPGAYDKGDRIAGLQAIGQTDCVVFHAGTQLDAAGDVITDGGRVLSVCALGTDVAAAQQRAYSGVAVIDWPGMTYRRDIGHRAIDRNLADE